MNSNCYICRKIDRSDCFRMNKNGLFDLATGSDYETMFQIHVRLEGGAIKNIKSDKRAETIANPWSQFQVILEILIHPHLCNRLFGYNGIKIK